MFVLGLDRLLSRAGFLLLMVIGASAFLVWQTSASAFSATTSDPTGNWASGTVALSDTDADTAMFAATDLVPGSTGSGCVAVTSTGASSSAVKLYGSSYTTTHDLASHLDLTVDEGIGGSSPSCTGFTGGSTVYSGTLAAFGTGRTGFSTGVGSWAPIGTAGETMTYRFTYTLSADTPNTAQGGSAALGFTWESQAS